VEGSDIFLFETINFNLETAPDKTCLMSIENGNQESVRTYVQRWWTHVQPPLIEIEMVMLFANTFDPLIMSIWWEKLILAFLWSCKDRQKNWTCYQNKKIKGLTMDYKIIMRDESKDGS
jgi:hypothetical protein